MNGARILIGLAAVALVACGDTETSSSSAPPLPAGESAYATAGALKLAEVAPGEHPGLYNVFRLSDPEVRRAARGLFD